MAQVNNSSHIYAYIQ